MPAARPALWVRSGPHGLTYLLQEADSQILAAAWQEHDDATAREYIENANRLGRESYERTVGECRESGMTEVEYLVADDACSVCQLLAGRTFGLGVAPSFPIAGCRSEFCRGDVVASFAEEATDRPGPWTYPIE